MFPGSGEVRPDSFGLLNGNSLRGDVVRADRQHHGLHFRGILSTAPFTAPKRLRSGRRQNAD